MANEYGYAVFFMITVVAATRAESLQGNPWQPNVNCSVNNEVFRCRCDAQCAKYGDCCITSPYFVAEQQVRGASDFTCNKFGFSNIYSMNKCPKTWTNEETRHRCESPDYKQVDPLFSAPVTNTLSNVTYMNWHCAACNDDLLTESSLIWPAKFQCFCDGPAAQYLNDIDFEKDAKNVTYNSNTKTWNFKRTVLTDGASEDINCTCNVDYTLEFLPRQYFRHCTHDLVDKCGSIWIEKEVQIQCEAYTDIICVQWESYRNPHCAICNYLDFEECALVGGHGGMRPEQRPTSTFTMLLDWKRLKNNAKCPKNEVYDPLAGVCRQVYLD